jgi:8-oxo-dGTP pyrophosphatase MutT (NUDIX family)
MTFVTSARQLSSAPKKLTDLLWRTAYRLAYPFARYWWRYRGLDSTKIAVWVNGRLLLVRHSYKDGWRLPGGAVKAGEGHLTGACRELFEEVGLVIDPSQLRLVFAGGNRLGITHLYEVVLEAEPVVRFDQREIVASSFQQPAMAAEYNSVFRSYLQQRSTSPKGFPDAVHAGDMTIRASRQE